MLAGEKGPDFGGLLGNGELLKQGSEKVTFALQQQPFGGCGGL